VAESALEENGKYEDFAKSKKRIGSLHINDSLHINHLRFDGSTLRISQEVERFLKKPPVRKKVKVSMKMESKQNESLIRLLNAIKNRRRLKILQMLSTRPHNLEEIRTNLKGGGLYHSLSTVAKYIEPLIDSGLIRTANNNYASTSLGKEIQEILGERGLEAFSPHSNCYEELCIQVLRSGRKIYRELATIFEPSTLQRVLKRLEKAELIVRNHPPDRVFFSATYGKLDDELSPTERRVLNSIKKSFTSGVPARELSKLVGINLRRTYKYLSRLNQKKRIAQWWKPVGYELTKKGEGIARCLEAIANIRPEFSKATSIGVGFDTHGAIKSDAFMEVRLTGEKGVLQSDLWKRLGWDGREGSRQVRRLERKGFIKRVRELRSGKWTYRIFPIRRFSSVDSIIKVPCAGCDEDLSGKCPNNTLTPENCQKLTKWLMDIGVSDLEESAGQRTLA